MKEQLTVSDFLYHGWTPPERHLDPVLALVQRDQDVIIVCRRRIWTASYNVNMDFQVTLTGHI